MVTCVTSDSPHDFCFTSYKQKQIKTLAVGWSEDSHLLVSNSGDQLEIGLGVVDGRRYLVVDVEALGTVTTLNSEAVLQLQPETVRFLLRNKAKGT